LKKIKELKHSYSEIHSAEEKYDVYFEVKLKMIDRIFYQDLYNMTLKGKQLLAQEIEDE
jgi:hypothetical protein